MPTKSKGKGYADLATLEFLNLIHSVRPVLPILCVVDCDPHGIDIMRTYKYGSRGLGHEENATVPGLQWLGVKMGDILGYIPGLQEQDSSQSSGGQSSQSSAAYFGSQGSGSYDITCGQRNVDKVFHLRLTDSQLRSPPHDRRHDNPAPGLRPIR